jgi:hypothetical protein
LAYALYPPEVAEDWMAETDIRREETIAKSGFQNSFVLLLFDLIWTADMVIQKILAFCQFLLIKLKHIFK